jgi:hypothetical protein
MNKKSEYGDVLLRWALGSALVAAAFFARAWAVQLAFAWVLAPVFGLPRIGLGVAWCVSVAVVTVTGAGAKNEGDAVKDDGLRWYPKWAWGLLWKTGLSIGLLWLAKTLCM